MTTPNPQSGAQRWNDRYSNAEYVYGTEPNDFLVEAVTDMAPGTALCIADGEGRNGTYLAGLGHTVTSVDFSQAAMTKAASLAATSGVDLTTIVADLTHFDLGEQRWDLIVSIFAHTPPDVRVNLHARVARALTPNGHFVLEAYTADQVGKGTGGPPNPELTMTLAGLHSELANMTILTGREVTRSIVEGHGHTGDGSVVQVIATPDNLG